MMKALLIFRKILVPLSIRLQNNLNSDKTVNTFVSKNLQNVNVNNVYFKRSPQSRTTNAGLFNFWCYFFCSKEVENNDIEFASRKVFDAFRINKKKRSVQEKRFYQCLTIISKLHTLSQTLTLSFMDGN